VLSPWEVLGVPEGASLDEVKAAYRAICLRQHPDRLVGAPESVRAAASAAMAMANSAYEVLLAASRGFEPPTPSTALVRRPVARRTAWDDALAPGPRRGGFADVAA
jgi:hypothetical protein